MICDGKGRMTHLVPDQCEAVSQPWAGHPLPFAWRLGAEALPLPAAGLQLVQLVGVLAVLDHAAEDEDARAVHHEAVGGAPRRDVALHRRHEPLVGGWNGKGGDKFGEYSATEVNYLCLIVETSNILHCLRV